MPKKKTVSIDGTKYEVKEAFEAKYRCRICSQHNSPTPCIARFNYPDKENVFSQQKCKETIPEGYYLKPLK